MIFKSKEENNSEQIKKIALYEELLDSRDKIIKLLEYKVSELEKQISIAKFYKTIEMEINNKSKCNNKINNFNRRKNENIKK